MGEFRRKACPKMIVFGQGESLAYRHVDALLSSLVQIHRIGVEHAISLALEA